MPVTAAAAWRERALVAAGLAAISAAGWVYLVRLAGPMNEMAGMDDMPGMAMPAMMAMPPAAGWAPLDALLIFVMWAIMMAAMMIPAATPMILLFATLQRRRRPAASALPATAAFLAGYLVVWAAFSLAATLLQWALHRAALIADVYDALSPLLGAAVLVAAGLYQFTPLKRACLGRCRSPLDFLSTHWRTGGAGAFVMGLTHGAYCLGCCWVLMALLFVAGVMNLVWIAAIAGFVLAEKLLPGGPLVGRALGAGLAAWGVAIAAGALM